MSRSIVSHQRALAALLSHGRGPSAPAVPVALGRAAGRVLAEDLHAPLDLPPHTNSQMDGYAVRVADLASARRTGAPVTLPVVGTRAAGAPPADHAPGTATAVMTGAVIPRGADAVLPVERVTPPRFDASRITVPVDLAAATSAGTFVRPAGSDVARGDVALPAGTRLGAAAVGACAALGLTGSHEVLVRRGPRVLVVSGGDEVVPAGAQLRPGTLYDANGPLLEAWWREVGAEAVTHLRVGDDPAVFVEQLAERLDTDGPDLVVTSGGISAGAFEVVRQGLETHGDDVWFGHVAVQPGGPQGHARFHGVPVVCVPGNPVSTWVSCEVLLCPALARVWGCCEAPRWSTGVLVSEVTPLEARTQLRRGRVTGHDAAGAPRITLVGGASSHLLTAAARADVLVRIPHGGPPLPAGSTVAVLPVAGGVLPSPAGLPEDTGRHEAAPNQGPAPERAGAPRHDAAPRHDTLPPTGTDPGEHE